MDNKILENTGKLKELINSFQFSKLSPEEKDKFFIQYFLTIMSIMENMNKITNVLEKIVDHSAEKKELNKEIKEIENTISLGIPGWIKYTRKIKKNRK